MLSLTPRLGTAGFNIRRATFPCIRRSISSAELVIEQKNDTSAFDNRPPKEKLVFGATPTDHMLIIEWDQKNKWSSPKIVPHQDLKLSPAASCLHYGLQCFEGMKAYKTLTDPEELRLFRPEMNMKRLSSSMNRLEMPGWDFDQKELIKCIAKLVDLDSKWIPKGEGYSMYLRPTVIATHKFLGLAPPTSLLLYVIMTPVGPYWKSGFNPIALTADSPYVRAWPGGTGSAKVGGNYACTMKAQAEAAAKGYDQVLWLFGDNEEITEVGSMNLFLLLKDKDTGRPELVTAPLDRGDILPGVARDSILRFARSHWADEMDISERYATMPEIKQAHDEGRFIEAFGAGTAAVVTPIGKIQYKGEDMVLKGAPGKITQRIWDEITGIQYGKKEDPLGWSVKVDKLLQ